MAERRRLVFCATCGVTLSCAQVGDEVARVVALVGAQREALAPGEWRTIIVVAASRSAVPVACVEFGLDHQPVAVLHQRVAHVGELRLLAAALAIELVPRGRSSRRAWRCCASRRGSRARRCGQGRAARPNRPSAGSSSSMPRPRSACRRPRSARPTTSRAPRCGSAARPGTCARPPPPAAARGSCVNTVGTHTGSSTPSPTNQR